MDNNLKIVRMLGGLANRMFQYSFYEYMKTKGYIVLTDNYYKGKLKHEIFDWERIFPNAPLVQPSRFKIFLYGGGYDIISKVRRKTNLTFRYYSSPSAFSIPSNEEIKSYDYFAGVFQHAEMVKNVEKQIKQHFVFSPFKDQRNLYAETEIKSCNSVAIHVRKGTDYLKRQDLGGVCGIEYYQKAVEYIKKEVDNPVFFVFSDNQDWVKENFKKIDIDYKLVNHNPSIGWGNHFDMQLMSCAKHNIIANSTYSWWGAFLNNNPLKIVIAPKQWFGQGAKSAKFENTTILPSWIAL